MIKSRKKLLKAINEPKKKHIWPVDELVKPINRVMDSSAIIIFFKTIFLFNYMIKKNIRSKNKTLT